MAVVLSQGNVSAQTDDFQPPPDPMTLRPYRAGEFYAALAFPVRTAPLCPESAACLFGGGGAVGAAIEWRFPKGVAFGAGYDVDFLDGNGVYEITTLQYFHGRFRYYGLREKLVHPFVAADVGFVLFGDAFRDNAPGAGVGVGLGFELEITSTLAFTSQIGFRLFATGPFVSNTDGVERAVAFGLDVATTLSVGLVLTQDPGTNADPR